MAGSLLFQQHFLPLFLGNDSHLSEHTSYQDFKEEFALRNSSRKGKSSASTKKFLKQVKKLVKKKSRDPRTLFDEDSHSHDEDTAGDDVKYHCESDEDGVRSDSLDDDHDVSREEANDECLKSESSDEDEEDSVDDRERVKGNATLKQVQNAIAASQIFTVHCSSHKKLTFILVNGTIIHVWVKNLFAHEYVYVINQLLHFDEAVTSVAYGQRHVLFLFPDNRLVVARKHVSDGVVGSDGVDSINADNMADHKRRGRGRGDEKEVEVSTYRNFMPALSAKKPVAKHVALSGALNLFMIWWRNSKDEVFPWTPQPEERANILIYSLHQDEPELKFFARTENNLLETYFIDRKDATIEVLALETNFHPESGQLLAIETAYQVKGDTSTKFRNEIAFPVQSVVLCHSYSGSYTRLGVGCSDRTVAVHSREGQITRTAKCNFSPTALSWHPHSHLLFVAGDQGQFQVFDCALTPILLCAENSATPSMTQELVPPAPVDKLLWAPVRAGHGNSYLMMKFRSGEAAGLRLALGPMKLLNLVKFYLTDHRTVEATRLLKNVQWSSEQCLQSMYCIFGELITKDYSENAEGELEELLALFFVPQNQPDEYYRKKHMPSVCLLAKKFFMWMLRAKKLERALQIALSLKEDKLVRHIRGVAEALNDLEFLQHLETSSLCQSLTSDEESSKDGDTNSDYFDSCSSSCSCSDESCSCYGTESGSSYYSYSSESSSKYSSEACAGSVNSGAGQRRDSLNSARLSGGLQGLSSSDMSRYLQNAEGEPDLWKHQTPSPKPRRPAAPAATSQLREAHGTQYRLPQRGGGDARENSPTSTSKMRNDSKIMIVHLGSV